MFRFLRIAGGIRIVAGLAMLPFLLSGTEAASPPSNTTVSANGFSPQDDSVASLGSAAAAFSQPPLALRCWLSHTNSLTRRFLGRAIIDPRDTKTAYVNLVGYGMPDRQLGLQRYLQSSAEYFEVTVDQMVRED